MLLPVGTVVVGEGDGGERMVVGDSVKKKINLVLKAYYKIMLFI